MNGRRSHVSNWIERYIQAWGSNDPEQIGALFTTDAVYYTEPYSPPRKGREAIVRGWIEGKDEPGTWNFSYEVLGVTGKLGFVKGKTDYSSPPRLYHNLWVIALDEKGACREFTEWFMKER